MSLELSLISFLRDDNLRSLFVRHITPEIIVEDVSRIAFDAVKRANSSDLGLILVEIKKQLDDRDLIRDIIESFSNVDVPVKLSDIERVSQELQSYIRWRRTITQVNYMASQNVDSIIPVSQKERESYQKLSEAIMFEVDADDRDHTFDFTIEEDYERAKSQSIPVGRSIKSRFNFVNNAMQNGGYSAGELIMFVAPTGGGKSTALAGEGVSFIGQGNKVLHYTLGDLQGLDMFYKYVANATKKSINSVMLEGDRLRKSSLIQDVFQNVRFRVKGTYEFDIDDLCMDAKRQKDKFDFNTIIVDYDGGLRQKEGSSGGTSSMYEEGGYVYGKLKQICTQLGCVGLVGCQSKVASWKNEVIGLDAAGESSKKQHHVDVMLTVSRPKPQIPIGTINIAKARRGETGKRNYVCYLFGYSSIIEISQTEYNMIKDWYDGDEGDILLRKWAMEVKGFSSLQIN